MGRCGAGDGVRLGLSERRRSLPGSSSRCFSRRDGYFADRPRLCPAGSRGGAAGAAGAAGRAGGCAGFGVGDRRRSSLLEPLTLGLLARQLLGQLLGGLLAFRRFADEPLANGALPCELPCEFLDLLVALTDIRAILSRSASASSARAKAPSSSVCYPPADARLSARRRSASSSARRCRSAASAARFSLTANSSATS